MRLALSIALALGLAVPAIAQDMTDAEREAFRAEVRAYLLEHPEVLMEAIGVLEQREQAAQVAADSTLAETHADALFNDGFSYVGGNPDGDITIVEFMDYRCGFCKRAFPEVAELLNQDGNIRYIVKEFPILGEQSTLAAQFAIAVKMVAGDDSYKLVHDTMMEMRGDLNEAALRRLADEMALDTTAIFETMASREVADIIDANHRLGQQMQINGTPTFVVETQLLRGYVPLQQMQEIVARVRG